MQVHLYGAGTNGRPLQQSFTLTGSASIGPCKGKHQGMGPKPPPHTQPHRSPGSPRAGIRGAARKAKEPKGRGGRERPRGHGITTGAQPGVAGNQTQAPQPGQARDHNTQSPHPHKATNTSPERRGQATKHTKDTSHTHPRTHNTHHHHEHGRHQHRCHKHTKHMKA